jgi:hypothetical protein
MQAEGARSGFDVVEDLVLRALRDAPVVCHLSIRWATTPSSSCGRLP